MTSTSHFSKTPLSFFEILFSIARAYCVIFPCILSFVFISSLGHWVIAPLYLKNPAFAGLAIIGFVFLTWFLFTAILASAKAALEGHRLSIYQALKQAKQRYLWVLGSNLIFFGIGIVLALVIFSLNLVFDLIQLHPVFLGLSIFITLFVWVCVYFAVPVIALSEIKLWKGFELSVRLVKPYWFRTLICLLLFVGIVLGFEALGILFTGQHRLFFFTAYQFFIQLLFYPLIVALTLCLLHDLKVRQKM